MYHWSPRREKEVESLFKEIMAKNFPILGRDLDIQVQEANKSPQIFNQKPLKNKTV